MGVEACDDCGGQVGDSAEACPHCGSQANYLRRTAPERAAVEKRAAVEMVAMQKALKSSGLMMGVGLWLIVIPVFIFLIVIMVAF